MNANACDAFSAPIHPSRRLEASTAPARRANARPRTTRSTHHRSSAERGPRRVVVVRRRASRVFSSIVFRDGRGRDFGISNPSSHDGRQRLGRERSRRARPTREIPRRARLRIHRSTRARQDGDASVRVRPRRARVSIHGNVRERRSRVREARREARCGDVEGRRAPRAARAESTRATWGRWGR